jgi:high-affinity iron transporter
LRRARRRVAAAWAASAAVSRRHDDRAQGIRPLRLRALRLVKRLGPAERLLLRASHHGRSQHRHLRRALLTSDAALSHALAGVGQELFNATVLAIAVAMLAWHNIWMARHGRELAAEMKEVGAAVADGSRSLPAVAIVVAVAVLREGSEIVLFLYGLVIAGGLGPRSLVIGGFIGLLLGCGVSALTFLGLVRIPGRYLFGVTTFLITFLAAGLAAQSVVFLQQAGVVTALEGTVWDTSGILSDTSLFGRAAHAFRHTDQPSGMQLLVYIITLLVIFGLTKAFAPSQQVQSASPSQRRAAKT